MSCSLPSDTYTEKLNQWGMLLSVMTYGAHATLFSGSLRALVKRRKRILLGYILTLFVLATVAISLQIWWTQVAFIDNRCYPGGPSKFLQDNVQSAPNRALTAMYLCMNWLADGLILYRFYVLCSCDVMGHRYLALAFVLPCSAALIVTALVFFPSIVGLGINLWTDTPTAPGIAYMTLSLSVNTTLTLLIVGRLLLIRRNFRKALGAHHGQPYTNLVALIIESASLYTIFALLTVIACGIGSPIQYALLPMLGQLQAIPPLLITNRLAEGLAFSKNTYSELSSQIKFSSRSPTPTMFTSITSSIFESPVTPPPVKPNRPSLKLAFPAATYSSPSRDYKFLPEDSPLSRDLEGGEAKPRKLRPFSMDSPCPYTYDDACLKVAEYWPSPKGRPNRVA